MLRVMIPTVRLDRSREKLVMTWEEDSCLYEISLTGVARALKSFLEKMYQTTLALVFLNHNQSCQPVLSLQKIYGYITCKKHSIGTKRNTN